MRRDEPRRRAIRLRRSELVMSVRHLDFGLSNANHRRTGFGESGHRCTEYPQQAERRVVANDRFHRHPGRQPVDVGPAQRGLFGIGNRQPEHGPGVRQFLERHAELLRGGAQTVDRGARPLQDVTGQPEQAAPTLGRHHLLGGEAKAVQVLDQALLARAHWRFRRPPAHRNRPLFATLAHVKGRHRRIEALECQRILRDRGPVGQLRRGHQQRARICPGAAAATNRAAKLTALPK